MSNHLATNFGPKYFFPAVVYIKVLTFHQQRELKSITDNNGRFSVLDHEE